MTSFSSLTKKVKSIDMFGSSIGFKINGQEQFKTFCGSCVTVLIIFTALFYSSNKYTNLWNRLDTKYQSSIDAKGIELDRNFTLAELEFNIAFFLKGSDDTFPADTYGYVEWEVSLLTREFVPQEFTMNHSRSHLRTR